MFIKNDNGKFIKEFEMEYKKSVERWKKDDKLLFLE
jgi:hypothetical protein